MLKSTTSRAFVILAVLLAAACLPSRVLRADDTAKSCLSSPNAAAPSGMHWYYRRDRTTNRLCWRIGPAGMKVRARLAAPEATSASSVAARPAEDKAAAPTREAAMREAEAAFIAGPALEKPTSIEESGTLARALGLSHTPSYMVGGEATSSSAR